MTLDKILPLAVSIIAVVFTGLGLRRNANHDTAAGAEARARMAADLSYIRASVDDIKLEYKAIQRELKEMRDRLVEVEQSSKSAHQRIDEIRKG